MKKSLWFLLIIAFGGGIVAGDYTSGVASSYHDNWLEDDDYVDSYISVTGDTFVTNVIDPEGYNNNHSATVYYRDGATIGLYGHSSGPDAPQVLVGATHYFVSGGSTPLLKGKWIQGAWDSVHATLPHTGYVTTHALQTILGSGDGNRGVYTLYPDNEGPIITPSSVGQVLWTGGNFSISISANDNSGSGTNFGSLNVHKSGWINGSWIAAEPVSLLADQASFMVSTPGDYTVAVKDNVGNTSEITITVVDKASPLLSLGIHSSVVSKSRNLEYWFAVDNDTSFAISAVDQVQGTGLNLTTKNGLPSSFKSTESLIGTNDTISLTFDTSTATIVKAFGSGLSSGDYTWNFNVSDLAGNPASTLVVHQRLLLSAPTITFPELGSATWKKSRSVPVRVTDAMGRTQMSDPNSFSNFEYSLDSGDTWTNLIPTENVPGWLEVGTPWGPIKIPISVPEPRPLEYIDLKSDYSTISILIRAKDEAGTIATQGTSINLQVDTKAPELSITHNTVLLAPDSTLLINAGTTGTVSLEIKEETSGLATVIRKRSASNGNWSSPLDSKSLSIAGSGITKTSSENLSDFSDGDFFYQYTATDNAGWETSQVIHVIKNTTPITLGVGNVQMKNTNYNAVDPETGHMLFGQEFYTGTTSAMAGNYSGFKVSLLAQLNSLANPASGTWALSNGQSGSLTFGLGADGFYHSNQPASFIGLLDNTSYDLTITVNDIVGNTATTTVSFVQHSSAPTIATTWLQTNSLTSSSSSILLVSTQATGYTVYQTTTAGVVGAGSGKLWDKASGSTNSTGMTFATGTLTPTECYLVAVDAYGNQGAATFKVIRPPKPTSSLSISKSSSDAQPYYTVSVSASPSPTLLFGTVAYHATYVTVGTDENKVVKSGAAEQATDSTTWTKAQLLSAKAPAPGSTGFLRLKMILRPVSAVTGNVIALESEGDYVYKSILNSPPTFSTPGKFADKFGKISSPFTESPFATDPDHQTPIYRYVVTSGKDAQGKDKLWTSPESSNQLPIVDFVGLATKGLTTEWLKSNGVKISLQAWAGDTTQVHFASDVVELTEDYAPEEVDLIPPSIKSVSLPWLTDLKWSSATSFTAQVDDDNNGTGVQSVTANATPISPNSGSSIELELNELKGSSASFVLPKTPRLSGAYSLLITVTDKARNVTTNQTFKAQFDYMPPSVGVTVDQVSSGTGNGLLYFTDSLGTVKSTLTGSDTGGSGLASWQYQVIDDLHPWVMGGPWVGTTTLEVNTLLDWGQAKSQKVRWRLMDKAGNASSSTTSDWKTVSYDPTKPDFTLTVTGIVSPMGSQRFVKSLEAMTGSVTPVSTVMWTSVRLNQDGTETVSASQSSWTDLMRMDNWWVDGNQYRIEATVMNTNKVTGTKPSPSFLLDRTGPSPVELTLVAPVGGAGTKYLRYEPFGVLWSGGQDNESGVTRTLSLYQVNNVTLQETMLSSVEVGLGQNQAIVGWGTSDIDWSNSGFVLKGVAVNGTGEREPSTTLAVLIDTARPWLAVSVGEFNAGSGNLAVSWHSDSSLGIDHYALELWKHGTTDTLLSDVGNLKGDSSLVNLDGQGLLDGDRLFVRVKAMNADSSAVIVQGQSLVSTVDGQSPGVTWKMNRTATSSRHVGGTFEVSSSGSGTHRLQWKIEKRTAESSVWTTILPGSDETGQSGWRDIGVSATGDIEADLTGVVTTNDFVRLTLRAENGVGQLAQSSTSDIVVDDSPPPRPLVLDQGIAVNFKKQDLTFNWYLSKEDTETGLAGYEYGWFYRGERTAPADSDWVKVLSQDILDNKLTASINLKTRTDAIDGKVVVLAVRSTNNAHLSSIGFSDGIILDQTAPLIFSVEAYGDDAGTNALRGYVNKNNIADSKVFLRVGAIDQQTKWNNGTVQAMRWIVNSSSWEPVGSPQAINGDKTELIIPGIGLEGSQWRFETKVTDEAGNTSAIGVSDGFMIEGVSAYVTNLKLGVDATYLNLSWGISNSAQAQWVQNYSVMVQWTDKWGITHTKTYPVSQKAMSLKWGANGLDLTTGMSVRFTVTAYSYTGASTVSSELSDYNASLTIDTSTPKVSASTMVPASPASQYYDTMTSYLAYDGDRSVSAIQWSAVLVPGEAELVDWQEKTWPEGSVWSTDYPLTLVKNVPLSHWNGKEIRLKYRAANSMGIWSEVQSSRAIRIDTTPPDVATLTRSKAYSNEVGSVSGWNMVLKDADSGVLNYMTALVPLAQSANYQWPETSLVHPITDSRSNIATEAVISIPLVNTIEGDYVPQLRVQNGTGHWFTVNGPKLTIDRTPPEVSRLTWPGTADQNLTVSGQSLDVHVSNGGNQALQVVTKDSEPVTWTITGGGHWFTDQSWPLSTSVTTAVDLSTQVAGELYPVSILIEDQAGNQKTVHETLRYNRAPQISVIESALTVRPGNPVSLGDLVQINDDEGLREGDYPLTIYWTPGNGEPIQYWIGGTTQATVFGTSHNTAFLHSGRAQVTAYTGTVVVTDRYGKSTEPLAITLRVENSHSGQLMVDEVWTGVDGDFFLRGLVTVPNKRTLTLDGASIKVSANLNTQQIMEAGILVEAGGTLIVTNTQGDQISTIQSAIDGSLWKGLRVAGKVQGAGLQISGAERALTLDSAGQITLSNSQVTNNLTGLHLRGGTLLWDRGTIASNREYGVKEDGVGSFILKNTQFRNNAVNYNTRTAKVLSMEEINNAGNSGNREVQ